MARCVRIVNRGHILAFYRPNFRLCFRTKRTGIFAFLIDFYLGIPATNSRHCHLSRHYRNSSQWFKLLLMSVTFYRCIEKRHSKSFLPHFSTFVEILLLKSCRKITAGNGWKLSCINFLKGHVFPTVGKTLTLR